MRQTLVTVALTASLLAATANHSPLLGSLWSFLSSLWNGATLTEGCGMDPSGRCIPARHPTPNAGCGMDPDGRCAPR